MFRQKEWIFKGQSGKDYNFIINKKSADFPKKGGLFILAYTHPRGHLAGFESHALYIGRTDNLKRELASPSQQDCVTEECWNCTYILLAEEEKEQIAIINDLRQAISTPC
ncbi:hypothetical protein [Maridesulfovibrio zosterae]|uniref:hypothetical protein n=1 Tax=Maridesulfovibrio zosterae TaxID=82171 RepID=UPI0004220095|nr:hypothetical protein [Maridesulfovibrio zosterae]